MGAAKRAERILQQIVASTLLIIHYVCIVSDRLEGGGGGPKGCLGVRIKPLSM